MALLAARKKESHSDILRALSGEVTPRVPFWLMRQAGRYLPEYRAVRKKAGSFLDLCFNPDYAAEVTLQPLERYDMDAAILFSDILVVPYALGQKLDFVEGEGPRLGALQKQKEFEKLSFDKFDAKLEPVFETVRKVKKALSPDKALIGFAGAPWTVACYMIQGKGDGEFTAARSMATAQPEIFAALMDKLVEATSQYLVKQIDAGADAIQLFDSWAGLLPEPLFRLHVIEPSKKIIAAVRRKHPDIPVIGFPRGAGGLYVPYAAQTGVNAVGLDTQVSLSWAQRELGPEMCLQGNLDPAVLLAGGKPLEEETLRILNLMRGQPFIFNLGHGVVKETPPAHVAQLASIIRSFRR